MKLFMRNECNAQTRISLELRMLMMPLMMMMMMMMMMLMLGLRDVNASVAATNRTCKHATNMWGDPNPNIFYVCNVADQMPLQLQCPQGRGFFNGHGHLGCLPYDQWPACRLTAEQASAQLVAGCDGQQQQQQQQQQQAKTMHQPWATMDPNQFYMCPGVNATPLLLSCAPGKGFVQTAQTSGCADWPQWRRQMQCEGFF
ncbi:uncharacterized protein LOC117791330 [Drosophila innubila]|uniref:uncharacterized protein LOC117791330 n=1 Tax=Drosophila innubila TaxID=198719 RepID=UPI00148E4069|nr:uncharacterized protein LOC117791330 [Drosophila innubila]